MVDKKLYEEIEEYCALNGLDTVKTLNKVIRNGLTILKYGLSPKPMMVSTYTEKNNE